MSGAYSYQAPPGWLVPRHGWEPPDGWQPDPSWPAAPTGWQFWRLTTSVVQQPGAALPSPQPTAPGTSAVTDPTEQTSLWKELESITAQLAASRREIDTLKAHEAQRRDDEPARPLPPPVDVVDLDDQRVLQDVGIYMYRHPVQDSVQYRDQLTQLNERIKTAIRDGHAVIASDMFTFSGSLAKGRKMTGDLSKLMLRAYNAEADNAMRTMRAGNSVTAIKRLQAAAQSIARLGSMMQMRIDPDYQDLRIQEIELTQDFLMKVQEEKERARDERAQLREERKAEQELRAEGERLQKERSHYLNVLKALQQAGDFEGAADAHNKLSDIDNAIARNDYRTANICAGYVYVISNVGAFGSNIVKIGMTRRLEPMDRIRELGGASVPFPFDIHALYFSADAVSLEAELHHAFAQSKVNHVNQRREFFFASPDQVRVVLTEKVGNLLEFTATPEATQYLQSKKYWPDDN